MINKERCCSYTGFKESQKKILLLLGVAGLMQLQCGCKNFDTDSCGYTDVDGVFSTDPKKIPVAKKIDKISMMKYLSHL